MAMINDKQRHQIQQTIHSVEEKTRGELVTVIAKQSDSYRYIPLLWAAIAALVFPGAYLTTIQLFGLWVEIDYQWLYLLQILVFVTIGLLLQWPALKMRLIPKSVKQRRASRLAHEQFFRLGLHHTKERTGVMIFVSEAEHFVEIIADAGINETVGSSVWQIAVQDFVDNIKAGKVAEGYVAAINDCGKVLIEHFPSDGARKDELPNHLIEI